MRIATFTHDMYASVAGRIADAECYVVPVNDQPEGYDYPPEVRFEIDEQDLESYHRAADFLNFANTDVGCLQSSGRPGGSRPKRSSRTTRGAVPPARGPRPAGGRRRKEGCTAA